MLVALVPVFATILGLLLWGFAGNAIVKEAGKIMFACGMLVTLFAFSKETVSLLR